MYMNQFICMELYRIREEYRVKVNEITSRLEEIAAAVDRARSEPRSRVTVIKPSIKILPLRFTCPECGCQEYREQYGFRACAWCGGEGRRVKA